MNAVFFSDVFQSLASTFLPFTATTRPPSLAYRPSHTNIPTNLLSSLPTYPIPPPFRPHPAITYAPPGGTLLFYLPPSPSKLVDQPQTALQLSRETAPKDCQTRDDNIIRRSSVKPEPVSNHHLHHHPQQEQHDQHQEQHDQDDQQARKLIPSAFLLLHCTDATKKQQRRQTKPNKSQDYGVAF